MKNIEQMATEIACAELINGYREHWIYDMNDEKLRKIAQYSAKLASFIKQETEKLSDGKVGAG